MPLVYPCLIPAQTPPGLSDLQPYWSTSHAFWVRSQLVHEPSSTRFHALAQGSCAHTPESLVLPTPPACLQVLRKKRQRVQDSGLNQPQLLWLCRQFQGEHCRARLCCIGFTCALSLAFILTWPNMKTSRSRLVLPRMDMKNHIYSNLRLVCRIMVARQ